MTNTIRAFIAIPLPSKVQRQLGELTAEMAGVVPAGAVRWVRPESMHLTVRFLGDTPVSRLAALQEVLDEVTAGFSPFTLRLAGLGCFPNMRRPRVIWAGVAGALSDLQTFKQAVDKALVPLGWPAEDRPFRAHLTLGRVKNADQLPRTLWSEEQATALQGEIPVQVVHLMESELTRQGPIYTIRHVSQLRA